jgi:D-alanyl-D-alanine carboxypeptidase
MNDCTVLHYSDVNRLRRKRARFVHLSALLLANAGVANAQARPATMTRAALVTRIDSIAAAPVKSGAVAGIAVAVVRGRDTLLMKGYGLADVENQVAVTPETVFKIGSLTKQFTSAAVMQLVERKSVSLDDHLNKYIPNFPTHGRTIAVRHLLNHTSGIPSYTDIGPRFGRVSRMDLAPDSLIHIVANDSLQFEPGRQFYYNNTGYFMLGMVIEKVTGTKYGDYLESNLFKQTGLNHTRYCDSRRIIPRRAQGYDRPPSGLVNTDFLSMQLPAAAGSLCSTIGDLVSWTVQLNSARVVTAESYRQMTTPIVFANGRPMTYGFGLSSDTIGGRRIISHGGAINGFNSFMSYVPQDSLVIVVLANTAPAPTSTIADALLRSVLALPSTAPPSAPKDLPLTSGARERYLGEYQLARPDGSRQRVRIFVQDERLMVAIASQTPSPLRNQGADTFLDGANNRFAFDVAGAPATGFMFGTGSRRLEAVRSR